MTMPMMRRVFRIAVVAAVLGAVISAMSLVSYFVRYSQHDGKLGLIPYEEYLQLTSMTAIEKSFLIGGSIMVLGATALAIFAFVRLRHSETQDN
ncbi:hypothetical protein [Arthrobacter bambusae]|uniref:hypothetical protein n=1 Tax=Arthrobacter bambusae TaxID=1338426 RepID=UPI002781AB45|nr:hypothetical protein [Arthrobacter bambusae]MDQ0029677.1 hypothetical protein [Arthrobacter bambusae]MDQ0097338.1 hypothetical protein [Arthrobacter bambusae]